MSAIGVVGAGRWGTVIAHTVARNGSDVMLYARDAEVAADIAERRCNERHLPELESLHDGVVACESLAELAAGCRLIVVALSVTEMRSTVHDLGDHVDGSHVIVHAVRGVEPNTFATPSRIIREETCVRKIGALMGPALVEEILAGHPSAAVVASSFPEAIRLTREALVSPAIRVYANNDLLGVESASAAVHIMALALGIQAELDLGPATRSILITRGVAEIARLCDSLGGSADTAFGLAGLGDLLVLAEKDGREMGFGRRLARGMSVDEIVEEIGELEVLKAAHTFHALAQERGVEAEITAAIHDILYAGLSPAEAILRLMTLSQMDE